LDQLAVEPERSVNAALDTTRKLLDLLRVVVTGVPRAVRIPIEKDRQRGVAVDLNQPVAGSAANSRS